MGLSDREVRNLKPEKKTSYSDGGGLYLEVTPAKGPYRRKSNDSDVSTRTTL